MRFASGVVGQWDCGMVMPERDELEAIGDTGTLFLDDPFHCDAPGIDLRRDGERRSESTWSRPIRTASSSRT